ncbi:testis-expressed protein 36-like [Cyprinodon tularosa]|uniref:testis-expressed protein 36-like n=1 Tax=Cyprinodon tularosa TaxID=77115 RepID=UPI0018E24D32|nr:testis-expressed protein 36-like [Cyprinodon tularosa]
MIRGRKHFSPSCNGVKWFPHPDCSESELKSRETSTTTGAMLKEVKSWSSEDYNFEHYPLYKVHLKQSREFPFSHHDNKIAFKNDILVFQPDEGRKQFKRFPNNHKLRSAEATVEQFMWFAQEQSNITFKMNKYK